MAYREERLQRQLLDVHAGGARPADDAAGERVGDERRVAEASARHAHVGGVGDMQPVRCRRLELPFHQIRSSARALRRFRRHRRPAAPDALNAELAHDVLITWSLPISAGSRPWAISWACIFLYPYTAMKKSEWISRMSRASASWRALMRLTGRALNMRQPRGVMNPQSRDPADAPQIGTPATPRPCAVGSSWAYRNFVVL